MTIITAQNQLSTAIVTRDSITITETSEMKFLNNSFEQPFIFRIEESKFALPINFYLDLNFELSEESFNNIGSATLDFSLYKKNLLDALRLKPIFNSRRDLGMIGQILGYTTAATAATLLVIHLKKYGWH